MTAQASFLDNSWADVEGDLHQDSSGLLQSFYVPLSYYHGVDSGESWSEGSRRGAAYLRRMPPGKYTMRLEVTREKPTSGGHARGHGRARRAPLVEVLGASRSAHRAGDLDRAMERVVRHAPLERQRVQPLRELDLGLGVGR